VEALRSQLPPKFDALDPAVLEDPYPTYARLRRAGPLCRAGPGRWMVTRYADVAALLADARLGNRLADDGRPVSTFGFGPAGMLMQRMLSGREPPDHTRLRQLMNTAFNPKLIRRLRAQISDLVDELLTPALDCGRFDAVTDLAFPLQASVVSELVGIPSRDRNKVWPEAMHLGRHFIPYGLPSPEQAAAADQMATRLREYVAGLLEERRGAPRDDLISRMRAAAEDRGEVTTEDVIDNLVFLCFSGFETTINVIATACVVFLQHPDELARLRTDRSLMSTAVEELLRYDAPAQYTLRITQKPIEIGDRTIKQGRMVLLSLGSANRDEHRFTDPERFDIGRYPNPHVSFGGGIHHCLGWALARMEVETVLRALLDRFATFEPAGEAVRLPHPNFRAHTSVPVSVRPA
jgi:cytochrome P450